MNLSHKVKLIIKYMEKKSRHINGGDVIIFNNIYYIRQRKRYYEVLSCKPYYRVSFNNDLIIC